MPSPVELIKERLGIAEVVGSYIKLEKAGANLKARCPFHNEKTPSFFVSPARSSFYCFGCGAKGDIFTFVELFEGADFVGALKILSARAGIELRQENPREKSERERLLSLMEAAAAFFERKLAANKEALEYLTKRGLSKYTIDSFRIGFAPDAWREGRDFLLGKDFTEPEIEKAGLIKRSDKENRFYDRFRSRIMFPIFDSAGRPIAFSGRIFPSTSSGQTDKNADAPKYLNSPETPLFSKSRVLFGFDRAKFEIKRMDYSILVEGQVDLIMCHQAGFKNAVASSGTALTSEQLTLLKRLSSRILMVYDADGAGIKASLKSAQMALALGMEVKVAALPKDYDPADLIRDNVAQFKTALRNSKHIIDFYLGVVLQNAKGRDVKKSDLEKILPLLASLESKIDQSKFIKRIADETGVREQAIYEDLKKVPAGLSESSPPEYKGIERKDSVRNLIFGLLFWQRRGKDPGIDISKTEEEVKRIFGEGWPAVQAEAEEAAEELIFEAESYYSGSENIQKEADDLLIALEEDSLKRRLEAEIRLLSKAEKDKNEVETKKRLEICRDLGEKLTLIKSRRT